MAANPTNATSLSARFGQHPFSDSERRVLAFCLRFNFRALPFHTLSAFWQYCAWSRCMQQTRLGLLSAPGSAFLRHIHNKASRMTQFRHR